MDLNRSTLIGNVTRDPEVRVTNSGQSVTNFGLATNMVWNDASGQKQERAEFHNLIAWGRLGETCAKYLKKGSRIYAEGRIQTRSWDDQTGQKKYRTEIVLDSMIMLDRLQKTQDMTSDPAVVREEDQDTPDEIKVEDIPF